MLHIAICDDSPIHQQIIQSEIEKALNLPYEITLFSSGLKFLEDISGGKCPYQIVFMDIALGKNDPSGILVAKKISLANPMTQIIFISQYLEFASDVYETTHVYFIAKDRLPELLEKICGIWRKIYGKPFSLPVLNLFVPQRNWKNCKSSCRLIL